MDYLHQLLSCISKRGFMLLLLCFVSMLAFLGKQVYLDLYALWIVVSSIDLGVLIALLIIIGSIWYDIKTLYNTFLNSYLTIYKKNYDSKPGKVICYSVESTWIISGCGAICAGGWYKFFDSWDKDLPYCKMLECQISVYIYLIFYALVLIGMSVFLFDTVRMVRIFTNDEKTLKDLYTEESFQVVRDRSVNIPMTVRSLEEAV